MSVRFHLILECRAEPTLPSAGERECSKFILTSGGFTLDQTAVHEQYKCAAAHANTHAIAGCRLRPHVCPRSCVCPNPIAAARRMYESRVEAHLRKHSVSQQVRKDC